MYLIIKITFEQKKSFRGAICIISDDIRHIYPIIQK